MDIRTFQESGRPAAVNAAELVEAIAAQPVVVVVNAAAMAPVAPMELRPVRPVEPMPERMPEHLAAVNAAEQEAGEERLQRPPHFHRAFLHPA
jgi:hypothetical protein